MNSLFNEGFGRRRISLLLEPKSGSFIEVTSMTSTGRESGRLFGQGGYDLNDLLISSPVHNQNCGSQWGFGQANALQISFHQSDDLTI
jgi:hypothetical protein